MGGGRQEFYLVWGEEFARRFAESKFPQVAGGARKFSVNLGTDCHFGILRLRCVRSPSLPWSRSRMKIARLAILTLLCFPFAAAQTSPNLDDGMRPYGSFHGGDIDSISLVGGNLNLHIPIISYPQRGGKLDVNYFLRLTSKNWEKKWFPSPSCLSCGYYKWVYRVRGSRAPDPDIVLVSNHHLKADRKSVV